MYTEVRVQLDRLDEFFATAHPAHASQLWDVLTALRGPDGTGHDFFAAKLRTTVPIRRSAFPRTAEAVDRQVVLFPADMENKPFELGVAGNVSWHFECHIRHAAEALGFFANEKDEP